MHFFQHKIFLLTYIIYCYAYYVRHTTTVVVRQSYYYNRSTIIVILSAAVTGNICFRSVWVYYTSILHGAVSAFMQAERLDDILVLWRVWLTLRSSSCSDCMKAEATPYRRGLKSPKRSLIFPPDRKNIKEDCI